MVCDEGDTLLRCELCTEFEGKVDVDGGRLRVVGLDALRALRYKPQALQIVAPIGERRQSGVRVVPQLLCGLSAQRQDWYFRGNIINQHIRTCTLVPRSES